MLRLRYRRLYITNIDITSVSLHTILRLQAYKWDLKKKMKKNDENFQKKRKKSQKSQKKNEKNEIFLHFAPQKKIVATPQIPSLVVSPILEFGILPFLGQKITDFRLIPFFFNFPPILRGFPLILSGKLKIKS